MLFEITHRTRYHYSVPVGLEPMTLRLRPRSDVNQTVRRYHVEVTPSPGGISHCVGLDGNNTETIWFNGMYENLLIEVHALVETHLGDPFNFLITDPLALKLPLRYEPHTATALAHYLSHDSDAPTVLAFTQEIMQATRHDTIPFLALLTERIPQRLTYMLREHGDPWTPEETLKHGQGACRDFSVLFMEVCRSVGIAARFVSGYCMGDASADNHMHAWVEVYLPGAGWRGFDPSRGGTVSNDHIAVAASHNALEAAPTFGHYRGEAVSSMTAEISMQLSEQDIG